jgi:hypothetical protein
MSRKYVDLSKRLGEYRLGLVRNGQAMSMCWGKTVFSSREEAKKSHATHRPYQCPICGKWHLTHLGSKEKR